MTVSGAPEPHPASKEEVMPKDVIERDMPGAAELLALPYAAEV